MRLKIAGLIASLACCLTYASAAELPITRVVLFSSGVGYFERTGEVDGDATVELSFRADQINDLLKSLVLLDMGEGSIGPVTYAPRDPLERTLRSFAVDIADDPSLSEFADSLRGTQVTIASGSQRIKGVIFGVETQEQPVGESVVDVPVVNVLTDEGIIAVPLSKVKSIKIADPDLSADLDKALDAIAASRNIDKRPVRLSFRGEGVRPVQVGYLLETPVWKTTYRLVVEGDKGVYLQGWAIVENTTDDDWHHVGLALVAGQPISFIQDLYEPLYVKRPVVPPQVRATTAAPQVYEGAIAAGEELAEAKAPAEANRRKAAKHGPTADITTRLGARLGMTGLGGGGYGGGMAAGARALDEVGAAAMAAGEKVGELFQYAVDQPVSIARQRSAMIPIVGQKIEAEKLSVYNQRVNAKFPLNGLKLKNTSGLHLMRGPVTVFDGNAYAGDAMISDIAPGDERLLTYAVDLSVEVEPKPGQGKQELVSLKIARGTLILTHKQRTEITYNVKNVSDDSRIVLIEHPLRNGWNLVQPDKPDERTRDAYRFRLAVKPKGHASLTVVEERPESQTMVLTDMDADRIVALVKAPKISDAVKTALQEIVKRKAAIGDLRKQREERQARLDEITQEQTRIRKNMNQLDRDSELYQMYVTKLTAQEKEFEQIQDDIKQIRAKEDAQQKELEDYILSLDIE